VLNHPHYSLDLAPADFFFISQIKNCDETVEIRGCFIDPPNCDDRTLGDTGISV
jgi:hypothetical protein